MKHLCVTFLLSFVFLISCLGQSKKSVSGIVSSVGTLHPVAQALIVIKDSKSHSVGFAYSDSNGHYKMILPRSIDTAIVRISCIGYKALDDTIQLIHINGDINFLISPSEAGLPEVNVISIPKILQKGDTTIYNADAFKKIQQRSIGDLLKNIPGFKVEEDGTLSYNGKSINRVLLDGDDMFSKDYGKLIKNFSANGIDKLELIQNYQDKSSLASSFNSTKEQVLNLKFKGNKFWKTSGSASISGGPYNQYEGKTDLIVLSKKIKFTIIGNSNTIGNLGKIALKKKDDDVSGKDYLPFQQYLNGVKPITPKEVNALEGIGGIYSFNHTNFANINSYYKITSSLIWTTDIALSRDNYYQYLSSTDKYYTVSPTLVVNQKDTLHNIDAIVDIKSSLTYNIGQSIQAKYTALLKSRPQKQYGRTLFNNQSITQSLIGTDHSSEHILDLSYKAGPKSLFALYVKIGHASLRQTFSLSPYLLDSLFHYGGDYPNMEQQSYGGQNTNVYVANWINKLSSYAKIALESGLVTNTDKFQNYLYAFNNVDSLQSLDTTFFRNLFYRPNCYYFTVRYSDRFSKKWNYSLEIGSLFYDLKLKYDNNTFLIGHKNGAYPRINFNTQFTFNKKSSIEGNYDVNVVASKYMDFVNTPILTGYNNLYKGGQGLQSGSTHTASFFYSYVDLFERKLMLFAGSFFQLTPTLYLDSLSTRNSYTIQNRIPFAGHNTLVSLFSRVEKIIPKTGSRLILSYNVSNISSFLQTTGAVRKNSFLNNRAYVQLLQNLCKYVDLNMSGEYEKSVRTTEGMATVNIQRINWHLTTDFKIGDVMNFSVQMSQINNSSNIGSSQHNYIADAYLDYRLVQNKLQLGYSVQNVFNKKDIEDVNTATFYTNSNTYSLRRVMQLRLIYKF